MIPLPVELDEKFVTTVLEGEINEVLMILSVVSFQSAATLTNSNAGLSETD
jgi:hypothetical protein